LVDFCHSWCKRSPLKTVWELVAMQQMSLSKGQVAHILKSPISVRGSFLPSESFTIYSLSKVFCASWRPTLFAIEPYILVEFLFLCHRCCICFGIVVHNADESIRGIIHQAFIFFPLSQWKINQVWFRRVCCSLKQGSVICAIMLFI
jgi:hypothetical protein